MQKTQKRYRLYSERLCSLCIFIFIYEQTIKRICKIRAFKHNLSLKGLNYTLYLILASCTYKFINILWSRLHFVIYIHIYSILYII